MDRSLQAQARAHGAWHRLRPFDGRQRPGCRKRCERPEHRDADGDGTAAGARGQSDPNSDAQWQLGEKTKEPAGSAGGSIVTFLL